MSKSHLSLFFVLVFAVPSIASEYVEMQEIATQPMLLEFRYQYKDQNQDSQKRSAYPVKFKGAEADDYIRTKGYEWIHHVSPDIYHKVTLTIVLKPSRFAKILNFLGLAKWHWLLTYGTHIQLRSEDQLKQDYPLCEETLIGTSLEDFSFLKNERSKSCFNFDGKKLLGEHVITLKMI